ncbi:MAG TPA: hypothetical protein VGL77_14930 [Armatimonadota bacterium]|jgi:hypothetical protein
MFNRLLCFSFLCVCAMLAAFAAPTATTPTFPVPKDGLVIWLDASDTATLTLQGTSVSAWKDKSGSGITAAQTDATLCPQLIKNALNTQAAVRFNGTTQYLDLGNKGELAQEYTIIAVLQATQLAQQEAYFTNRQFFYEGESSPLYLGFTQNQPFAYYNTASTSFVLGKDSGISANVPFLQTLQASAKTKTVTFFVNGGRVNETKDITNLATRVLGGYLGFDAETKDHFGGDLAEFIVYTRLLTDAERKQVEGYLLKKYGLTAAPAN